MLYTSNSWWVVFNLECFSRSRFCYLDVQQILCKLWDVNRESRLFLAVDKECM